MTIGDSFAELLEAARRGSERALERLYRDLAPGVVGYLRGHGSAEAEDVASDVFVAVVRGLPRFRGDERAFRSWVFAITHRRLMDERRRLARRGHRPVDPAVLSAHLEDALVGDSEDEAIGRLEGASILRTLTPDQRAVILLRVLADLPVAEVARILGKPEGAVKALQRRAVATLARQVEREGVS
jgi:RNA polymerase sigma factor (sigma-70 family)